MLRCHTMSNLRRIAMKNTMNCWRMRQLRLIVDSMLANDRRMLSFCNIRRASICSSSHWKLERETLSRCGLKSCIKNGNFLNIPYNFTEMRTCKYSTDTSKFSIKDTVFRQYIESLVSEYNALLAKHNAGVTLTKDEHKKVQKLTIVKDTHEEVIQKYEEMEVLVKLLTDDEMKELAEEEKEVCIQQIEELEKKLVGVLIPEDGIDESDIILEVESGAGGQEAMLFAQSVFEMYEQHAAYKGWQFKPLNSDITDLGGIRSASASISGRGVYREMKFEGGIHRVQRIPVTEKGSRIHTSTISVAVLPQPQEIDLTIHPNEIKMDTLAGATSGGQHAQKNETSVRLTHLPTGIMVFCSQERSQFTNKKLAMAVLRSRLYNKKLEEERGQIVSQRKIQVGQKNRSEKIRTYNYPQGRITDHRIGRSMYGIDLFMAGGANLDEMISEVVQEARKEDLEELIELFEGQTTVRTKTGKKT